MHHPWGQLIDRQKWHLYYSLKVMNQKGLSIVTFRSGLYLIVTSKVLITTDICKYSIDLKIVAFPWERDFYFFEIIRLVIFVEPFNSSQKARNHRFSNVELFILYRKVHQWLEITKPMISSHLRGIEWLDKYF